MIALIIILGVAGAGIILINPFFGLLCTAALIPQSLLPAISNMLLGAFTLITPIKLVGGFTFLATFLKQIFGGKSWDFMRTGGFRWYLVFLAYVFVNGFAMPSAFTRESFTVYTSFAMLGFCILALVNTPARAKKLVWAALVSVWLVSLNSIYNYLSGASMARMSGGAYGPNEFAIGILPFIGLSFYAIFSQKKMFLKLLLSMIALTLTVALILTQSRGGLAGFVGMSLFSVFRAKRKFLSIIFIIILGLALANFLPQDFYERIEKTRLENTYDEAIGSTVRRYYLARAAWEMYLDNPIFGMGLGNYYYNCRLYYPLVAGRAHNMYLEIMAEMGTVGILLFMSVILSAYKSINRIIRSDTDLSPYGRGLFIGLTGFLVSAVFLHAQTDKSLWLSIFLAFALARMPAAKKGSE